MFQKRLYVEVKFSWASLFFFFQLIGQSSSVEQLDGLMCDVKRLVIKPPCLSKGIKYCRFSKMSTRCSLAAMLWNTKKSGNLSKVPLTQLNTLVCVIFQFIGLNFLHWLVCRSLDWVIHYLNGRQQFMKMGYRSKSLNIACGVPQGSVLGPKRL